LTDLLDVYLAERNAPIPARHLLPLLTQAARALDFLNNRQHRLNGQLVTVQHCDVTANNLLVFGQTLKLSDFGLATTLSTSQKIQPPSGTPAFAAPEVFQGRVSDRTDQYALAVCYCLLRGGRLPFTDTPGEFLPDYVRPTPDLSMLAAVEQPAVARALAPSPRDRWASCGEWILELQKQIGVPPFDGRTVKGTERRRDSR
jgi:serine/threonine protein kinase